MKSVPGSPPPNGSSGPSLMRKSAVPSGTRLKSTITSRRSATASCTPSSRTGAGRNPPSAPITQNGRAGVAGRRVSGLVTIFRISTRVLLALSKRKRYRRGSTSSTGQVRPLTTIVLPKNSGGQVGPAATQQVEPGQAGVEVDPGQAQLVVVEPQCGGPLVVRVLEDRGPPGPDHPLAAARLVAEPVVEGADPGEAGRDVARHRQVPRLGVPVALLGDVRPVQMGDEGHRSPVRAGRRFELRPHVPT